MIDAGDSNTLNLDSVSGANLTVTGASIEIDPNNACELTTGASVISGPSFDIASNVFGQPIYEAMFLIQNLQKLSAFLTEKSFSPAVSFCLCSLDIPYQPDSCKPAIRFWVPNVRREYVHEIILPGVLAWCKDCNRSATSTIMKLRCSGAYFYIPLDDGEIALLTDARNTPLMVLEPFKTYPVAQFNAIYTDAVPYRNIYHSGPEELKNVKPGSELQYILSTAGTSSGNTAVPSFSFLPPATPNLLFVEDGTLKVK